MIDCSRSGRIHRDTTEHNDDINEFITRAMRNACSRVYGRSLVVLKARGRARAPTFATIHERVAAYIKERSSVRPIFHACIAILDARDASGTSLGPATPPHLTPIKLEFTE